jgi:hypothetical protein
MGLLGAKKEIPGKGWHPLWAGGCKRSWGQECGTVSSGVWSSGPTEEDLRIRGDHNGARLLFVEGETGETGRI